MARAIRSLPTPLSAGQQDSCAGGCDSQHGGEDLLHLHAAANDVIELVSAAQFFP